jgi:energy-coupling factor transport system substrate-specific component
LASAGQDLRRVSRGSSGVLAYVGSAPGTLSDVGSLERTILVARAGNESPRHVDGHDLVAALQRHIRRNGSVSDQVNLTAFAVLALRAAGVPPPARTYSWLDRQRDDDGGFNFAGAGGTSDIDDTGAVLEALGARGGPSGEVRRRAVAYLRDQQDRDGGFPQQPGAGSNAQSTAWAAQGFAAAGVSPASVHRRGSPSPLAYLRSLQAPDGHIRYARGSDQTPVWVTGQALMALKGQSLPIEPPAATRAPLSETPAAPPSTAPSTTPSSSSPQSATTSAAASPPKPAAHSAPASVRAPQQRGEPKPASTPNSGPLVAGPIAGLASVAGLATALVLAPIDLS